jgi:hypothetical protein
MTLTDIKRPQAIAVFSKYLVYQALSGVSVSRGTLCLMTPPHPWNILEDERGCNLRVWDAGPEEEGGGTRSDWLGNRETIRHMRDHIRALGHLVSESTDSRVPF